MELQCFADNTDSLLISVKDVVLRCDLHQRYIDHLYLHRHSHQRVLKSKRLHTILDYDKERLLQDTNILIRDFTIPSYHITNVYRHDRNDRFVLLETRSKRLELDKELNGLRDRSTRTYNNMYRRKPDNYYKGTIVKEYQRILKEIQSTFRLTLRTIQRNQHNL